MPTNSNNNNERPFQNLWTFGTDSTEPSPSNESNAPELIPVEPRFFDEDDESSEIEDGPGLEQQIERSEPASLLSEESVIAAMDRLMTDRLSSMRGSTIVSGRTTWMSSGGAIGSTVITSGLEDFYGKPVTVKEEIDPEKLVKLVNGDTVKYKDAVMIDYQYYLKTDKDIIEDYFRPSEYIHKNNSAKVNIAFDDEGFVKSRTYGYYDPRRFKCNSIINVDDSKGQYNVDYNVLPKDNYVECFRTGIFYHKTISHHAVTNKQLKIKARKATCIYKPSYGKTNLAKDYAMGVLSPSFIKTEGKRYTFGLEMETISGYIPQRFDSELNYLSIRDGSLKDENGEEWGHEYVTGVLIGDTGMLQSKKLCNALTTYCMVNRKCG